MAKVVTGKTRQRAVNVDFKAASVLGYDADNCYPQRVMDIIQASGVASSCTEMFSRYVFGDGITISGNAAPRSFVDVVKRCVNDWCMWRGFAVHVSYNAFGEPIKYSHMPFEFVRFGIEKKAGMYGIHPNWDKRDPNKPFSVADTYWLHPYNPATVLDEIAECEGKTLAEQIGNYKGQLLYVTPDAWQYPLAHIDPVMEDVITSSQTKLFKNKNIRTNFLASHLLVHKGEFQSDEAREDFLKSIEAFQGAEKAGNVMVIEATDDSQVPQLLPFTIQNNDKLWEYTEKSVIESIVRAFNQPPVLAGILQAGKLGTSNEINEAHEFYNAYTQTDRDMVMQAFTDLIAQPVQILPKKPIYQVTPPAA